MNNTCPICFEGLVKQNRATPDTCDHIFCSPCLEKWSRHGSYCPVDRKRFKKIVNLDSETVIQIKPCKPKQTRVLYDVTTYCEVCKKHNNASTLLLCDCCDLGYHCKCLQPPLQEVPPGVWNCPVCVAVDIKIKKSKEPKAVQERNEAQSNQEDLPSKSRRDIERTSSNQVQSSVNRTQSASLIKSSPRNYSNDETICADNFLFLKTKVDKSLKINNLSATTSSVKDPLPTQITIKSKVKNNSTENISSWSRRLRNRNHGSKSNETVAYCSVAGQNDNKQEQRVKNEVKATSVLKDEQINVCPLSIISDFENNSIEGEGINNFKTESKSSLSIKLRNKDSRLVTNKGKSYSCTSLETNNQDKSSSCPSQEDKERIESNSSFNEVNKNHEILPKSNNLSNSCRLSISHANKVFQLNVPDLSNNNTVFLIQENSKKFSKNTTQSSKYDSEFSKNPLKATRRSARNILGENKDKLCVYSVDPEIGKKKMLRNLEEAIKDSEGSMNLNTDIINTPDVGPITQRNIHKDIIPKLTTKKKQTIKKNYVQPNTEEGLNKNDKDTDLELLDRKVNSAKIETNFENTRWCIHYCQKPDNYSVPCLKKENNLKSEKLNNKEHFPTFQTNVARNKYIIPSIPEVLQKKNVIVNSQNNKEYSRNVQNICIDVKNDSPFVDSSISLSETPVIKVSKESKRSGTSLSLKNSKNIYLTKDSEKYKLSTNSCLSIDETGVLIHPESSESVKYYFLTKKSISNFAMEKLSLLASEKNKKQNMNKMGQKWYHYEEQDPSISNNEVFNNSIESVTALSATPGKYAEPSSKKITRHGLHCMKEQDSVFCNSDIPEMNIHSTVFTALTATSEEISKDKTGQSSGHKEKKGSTLHNNVSEKSIHSTVATALCATSKKYKEPSKDKTGQSSCHKEKKDQAVHSAVFEKSSLSTVCTATPRKYKEPIKNKPWQGWYYYENEDPAISTLKMYEKGIQSKVVSGENEAGSQKPKLCASSTKIKTYISKNAQQCNAMYTSNISSFNSLNQDPITTLPKFSVFESVDRTYASSLNKSNMDTSLSSKNTLSICANASINPLKGDQSDLTPCGVPTASSAMNTPKSYRSREVHKAIKAKMNLANELLKIEREKWPRHLKKYKHRQSSGSKISQKRERDAWGSELTRSKVT